MSASNLHIAWAQLFLHAAWCAGVRDIVVSPGSRSTPLALAAHHSPELRSHFIVDERAAAFFALGQARITGRPTLLACTSGTAGAHYYPAVIEASMSGIPLLVVTADRPWELQHTHAAQTIDQTRLFGDFPRLYLALGAPEPTAPALRALARTAAQAVARALAPEPGPVHINAPFRKPLEPVASPEREPWTPAWEALLQSGPTRSIAATPTLDAAAIDPLADLCKTAERGLIVCGPAPAHGDLATYRHELAALARTTGFPILAEATSQARFGLDGSIADASIINASTIHTSSIDVSSIHTSIIPASITDTSITDASISHASITDASITDASITDASITAPPTVLSAFDALLRSPAFRARFAPDLILELGAPPTSTGYAQLLADHPRCPRVVVAPLGWTDPASTATTIVHAPVDTFCRALRTRLADTRSDLTRPTAWARALAAEDARARSVIDASIPNAALTEDARARAVIDASIPTAALTEAALTEAAVARAVVAACPPGSVLVLGNSSPVRDVDLYCHPSATPLRVLHQRGASGIDGLVAGAAGAHSTADGAPVSLLLGDISLLHDLTSLVLARGESPAPPRAALVITVVDNGGGRIFEQLPIGRALAIPFSSAATSSAATSSAATTSATSSAATFERCFATPQHIDFAAAAAAFGVPHARVTTPAELTAALAAAHARPGATLVQAMVPPHDGATRARSIWTRIDQPLPSRKDEPS